VLTRRRTERGSSPLEYALILAGISLGCIVMSVTFNLTLGTILGIAVQYMNSP
jgi:Flp pilus assembly pilin Flp